MVSEKQSFVKFFIREHEMEEIFTGDNNPPADPFQLFAQWFDAAKKHGDVDPTVMTLATATLDGKPSARIVLLKGFDENGFVFYTNMGSRKARELQQNPQAALCFYWFALDKQVRVEGRVRCVSDAEADEYFATRPRGSQVGAWASKQSQPMERRDELFERVETIARKFEENVIPRPVFWSGYCLQPERVEFWQQGEHRLHTRVCYEMKGDRWSVSHLFP